MSNYDDDTAEMVHAAGEETIEPTTRQRLSKRNSKSRRKSKRGSQPSLQDTAKALLQGDLDILPESSSDWAPGKRGAYLGLVIHGVVMLSVIALLVGINGMVMAFSKHKYPWVAFPSVIWLCLFGMHLGITWGILRATGSDTKEIDNAAAKVGAVVIDLVGKMSQGYNPFPAKSRIGKMYRYWFLQEDERN